MDENLKQILREIEDNQYQKLYKMGSQIRPNLTPEDLLQPNDYPDLENNPLFRYEEGVLEGIKTVEMALRAFYREKAFRLS